MQAPHATLSLLRLGVATGLASAADASAQSLKVTGLTHSRNQITPTSVAPPPVL